jgi:hypothetical protein
VTLPLSPLVPPEAVLAAIAAGWALGLTPELIGAGLRTFEAAPKKHITERTRRFIWKSYAPAPFAARTSGATTLRWKSSFRARRKNNRSPSWPAEQRLRARFPPSAHCSRGNSDAVPLARVLEVAALSLQAQPAARSPSAAPRHAGRRHLPDRGRVHRRSGRPPAVELAEALINAALTDAPFDLGRPGRTERTR